MGSICLYMLIQKKVDKKLVNPTSVHLIEIGLQGCWNFWGVFGRSGNPNPTRGAHYVRHITTCPLVDFQTFHWLMYLPKSGCHLPPARLGSDGPLPIAVVYVHTYLIDKIYTLLGSFNDVKNASVRTHVLTGTYFSQIAQHISQKFYHQI